MKTLFWNKNPNVMFLHTIENQSSKHNWQERDLIWLPLTLTTWTVFLEDKHTSPVQRQSLLNIHGCSQATLNISGNKHAQEMPNFF